MEANSNDEDVGLQLRPTDLEDPSPLHSLSKISETHEPLTLITLPIDILFTLHSALDPTTSTCLGLAHSSLYTIHLAVHGLVPLAAPRTHLSISRSTFFRALREGFHTYFEPHPEPISINPLPPIPSPPHENGSFPGSERFKECERGELYYLLGDWVPAGLVYSYIAQKYMSEEANDLDCEVMKARGRVGSRGLVELIFWGSRWDVERMK